MLNIRQAIDIIGDYYSLNHEGIPHNQDLVQKIFDQLTQETYQTLNETEKQTLDRFYTDVSNISCADHPEYVAPVSIYHRVIRLTPFLAEKHSDSILRSWSESTQPNEQEAYQRICSYIDRRKTSSSFTPLNLSNLDLTILPKCLFTDPIFSGANLAGNPLKEFPPELAIGSVQNLDNFECVRKVIDSKDFQVKPTSLESELPQTELDITQTVDFPDCRTPNEGGIEAYRHVFKMDEPGLLVSTGTERSFYGLIQAVLASPPNYCQGLVIRDINPKVKAYVDFNVLLLRLATNVTEYAKLSHSCFPSL
ncbi:MAG: hypothetical protein JSS09_06235, partial [Verrucomicrobia bacterium]|nr:hypothetical protein [Verrucomicrobiota bacterium]